MASIFLSYSREDAAKADRIALALEDAGHDVWWDRRIGAGSRFTKEIDAALKSADLVVVLWSKASVESAWVQDEAADGRDSGRLVPVLIEKVSPPLGYRQYQSIDLFGSRGANPVQPLLDAISARLGETGGGTRPTPRPKARPLSSIGWRKPALVAVVAALIVAAYFLLGRSGDGHSIAIAAEGGDPAKSQDLARSLTLGLSQYRSGPLGTLTILQEGDRGASAANYQVGVGISESLSTTYVDLSLSSSGDSRKLWATALEGQPQRLADMRQQATAALGNVLTCLGEIQEQRAKLNRDVLGLYLNGCGKVSDITVGIPADEAVSLFRQVTEKVPDFAPAWAWLALLDVQSLPGTPEADVHQKVVSARANVRKAKSADPTLAIVYAADASLPEHAQSAEGLSILEAGLKVHPDSAMLHARRSELLSALGRTNEAITEARAATELDPLSPTFRDTYASALAYAGRTDAAFNELRKAEAIWPGSTVLRDARYRLDLRYGDPGNALRLLRERGAGDLTGKSDAAWEKFLAARANPTPARVEAALDEFRARNRSSAMCCDFGYLQALGTFNRVDEAYRALEPDEAIDAYSGSRDAFFRIHMRSIYSDPRFMRVAQRLGMLEDWQSNGRWPDICRDPKLPYDCRTVAAQLAAKTPSKER